MKISRNWLEEFVKNKDIDDKTFVNKMTLAGVEYESIKPMCTATNLVVGQIETVEDHPNADKLHVCTVNIGTETTTIVCGAPNVKAGRKVIVALPGAVLPGNVKIKKSTIRNVESNGMLCALEELGFESKYVPDRSKNGIHILEEDAPVGTPALEYLHFDDTVVDFDLTSNRSDLLSIMGMSYETAAVFNRSIQLPEFTVTESEEATKNLIDIDLQTELCNIYSTRIVKNIEIKESPNFIKARLIGAGIRPINNVVDISNYVMLEYGQPLHFFDYDKLGNKIIVRMAQNGETITTLDGKERTLDDTDIVIADANRPVALAGVMGGFDTEITDTTQTILIESAVFDPYHIRYTSKKILRSEASARYEKGVDTRRTNAALDRAAYLLEQYASGTATKGIVSEYPNPAEDKLIEITLSKINTVLGMNLAVNEVVDIFNRLGFKTQVTEETFRVSVPTRRLDISIKEDLIEEIGRLYGYTNMQGQMPVTPIKPGKYTKQARLIKDIRKRLEGFGLHQAITYSLNQEDTVHQFTKDQFDPVIVQNPMSEDRSVMRYSVLPSLLKVINYNYARNIKTIKLFEIGASYALVDGKFQEETKIAGALIGKHIEDGWQNNRYEVDFYVVKGIVQNILLYLRFYGRITYRTDQLPDEFHPGRSAEIFIDETSIGYIGQVHPNIDNKPIYLFELNLNKLMTLTNNPLIYEETPKYPVVHKDVAFLVDKQTKASDIMKTIAKAGGKRLLLQDIFDVYTGENIAPDQKSLAFNLVFQDKNKTLEEEEINHLFHKIIKAVEQECHAQLRDK